MQTDWIWYGHAAHLCVSNKCRFHLTTVVGGGKLIVSTVGEYFPDGATKPKTIGLGRLYETMVFKAGDPCTSKECGCGLLDIGDHIEVAMRPYNTRLDAMNGHVEMCKEYDHASP